MYLFTYSIIYLFIILNIVVGIWNGISETSVIVHVCSAKVQLIISNKWWHLAIKCAIKQKLRHFLAHDQMQ